VIDFSYGVRLRASSPDKRPILYREELGLSSADAFGFEKSSEVCSARNQIADRQLETARFLHRPLDGLPIDFE